MPEPIKKISSSNWNYYFNFTKSRLAESENVETYECDILDLFNEPTYENVVAARVRYLYSEAQEFSLINNYNRFTLGLSTDESDKEDYLTYLAEVAKIKIEVKSIFDS